MGRGRHSQTRVRCPEAAHAGSRVSANGKRKTKRGTVARYLCDPLEGDKHSFSILGLDTDVQVPTYSPPPECPEHPGSHVVKGGTYGKTGIRPKQMYRCFPATDERPHYFTWAMPRDHVHTGEDDCSICEELRGEHRGDRNAARRLTWSERRVAAALKELAGGKSYAKVSRDMWRATERNRTRKRAENADPPEDRYLGTALSANRWHTAADWVEVFAPVLWDYQESVLREQDRQARATSDSERAAGRAPSEPVVLLIDDIPIKSGRKHDWHVLVAGLVQWHPAGADPWALPGRTLNLRLVRGMPSSDSYAYRLLLDEWGSRPDFIVADAGTGLMKAGRDAYGGTGTTVLPSLFHLRRAVTFGLLRKTPGAADHGQHNETPMLLPELHDHLRALRRHTLAKMTRGEWKQWWDDLEAILAGKGLLTEPTRERRANYEKTFADLLGTFRTLPQLPMSSGGLEVAMRQRIEPVLAGRAHAFANAERTNRLFDLVVCDDHGMFDDAALVAHLLRADNERASGWATPLRACADPRTETHYSSLRDVQMLRDRARKAGLT